MTTGFIRGLTPTAGEVVQYHLDLGEQRLHLNPWLGQSILVQPTGRKQCVWCGRQVKKLFSNGSCYPCFRDLPQNDLCIVKPSQCHFETCRDQPWGEAHCMVPTTVYLARTSGVKVGLSRNLPGRWLEQGALAGVAIARLPTRKQAGELELHLAAHLPDKTDWRRMLRGEVDDTPLSNVRERVLQLVPPQFRQFILPAEEAVEIRYPGTGVPDKLVSLNLDKGSAAGRLLGIKARYLVLDIGVLNVERYAGYEVDLTNK